MVRLPREASICEDASFRLRWQSANATDFVELLKMRIIV
jgi:hypothetical protein